MIVDASVAVPWLIDTPFAPAARALKSAPSRAPSLILIEVTSSLLKYRRAGQLGTVDISRAITMLSIALNELVQDAGLLPAATEIASAHNHKIYDCLYLALAMERHEPLATADRRLAALAGQLGIDVELVLPA